MKRLQFEVGHGLQPWALPGDEHNGDGTVKKLRSNVLRPHEFLPTLEEADQLRILEKACQYSHCSEKFFLTNANASSSWLRTVIEGDMTYWTRAEGNELDSDIIIRSNIVPYEPHWSKLRDWSGTDVGIRQSDEGAWTSAKKMKAADLRDKRLAKGNAQGVWKVTLKGGQFIGKTGNQVTIQAELRVLDLIEAHPHIVYSFDHKCDEARMLCEETFCGLCDDAREAGEETTQPCEYCGNSGISAYFMEYMASDLRSFIVDRVRMAGDKPPFEPEEAVDILSQIAKAMKHIHDKKVVHCDVKSDNVLICEIPTGDGGKQYLVKVADFGSATQVICPAPFIAGSGTTAYSSPEVLKQRSPTDSKYPIEFPYRIDVYSFGIMGFEVLTGNFDHISDSTLKPTKFKKGVISEGKRPLIRKLTKDIDERLISLVEKCWHEDPSQRPTFATICEDLDVVERRDKAAKQAKLSNGSASAGDQIMEETSPMLCAGARAKKASLISKALQSAKDKVRMSRINKERKKFGRSNPG